jgi:alkanesulfonate monooxygenase SsuD/methylene tetrahydromethanopterin reductase-like flavin-dependent oxidoreductase (luciferase family)
VPDYGHELQFGVFIPPAADQAQAVLELAQLADAVGLDLVTFQDHPYQARFLDTWTLLSVVAAHTANVRVAPNVANLPLRQPVVLARSVASLDLISGGRVELGLGAGTFWDAIAAVGGPRRTPPESVDALAEAIDVIRAVWSTDGGPVRHEGEHYRVVGAHPGPPPAHDVEIWLGAYKPRMLALTGAKADGWLPSLGYIALDELAGANARIDDAAANAGRRGADVRRLLNLNEPFEAERLAELTLTTGLSTYILSVASGDEIRRFAEEVAPAARELVETERGRGGRAPEPASPTPDQEAAGRHLIDVHNALRAELERLRDLIDQVGRGSVDPTDVRSFINRMTIRQNNWTLGAFCESYCRVVTQHHMLEDRTVFPHLRRSDPELVPVLDRLAAEHETIADLLERVDGALVELVAADHDGIEGVKTTVDLLADTLLSHFAYEERELVEPLARHGFY